jgi:hypothetical protein
MPKPQRVTIPEIGVGSGPPSWSTWLWHAVVLTALTLSGCTTTAKNAGDGPSGPSERSSAGATIAAPGNSSIGETVKVTRLQSPAPGPAQILATPDLPPLPDPIVPSIASEMAQPSLSQPPADDMANTPSSAAATVIPPPAGGVLDRNSPALQGRSSIARNRLRNRQAAAPLLNPDGSPGSVPAGATTSGSGNSGRGA